MRLSKEDHECVTSQCYCLFEVKRTPDGPMIAVCVDYDALLAVKRLLKGTR